MNLTTTSSKKERKERKGKVHNVKPLATSFQEKEKKILRSTDGLTKSGLAGTCSQQDLNPNGF